MYEEKPIRFKRLLPIGDDIMEDYLENDMNMSAIAVKYGVHYSNLRRFIKHRIKELGLEETLAIEYVNQEDFPYLDIGDTYQWGEGLTIWSIVKLTVKDGDLVYEMSPTVSKNPVRHWICDERQ